MSYASDKGAIHNLRLANRELQEQLDRAAMMIAEKQSKLSAAERERDAQATITEAAKWDARRATDRADSAERRLAAAVKALETVRRLLFARYAAGDGR